MSVFDRRPVPARRPAQKAPPHSGLASQESAQADLGMLLAEAMRPQPRDRALDVLCGLGHVVLPLSMFIGAAGRVVGVDPSADLLKETRRRREAGWFHHVELYAMPPEHLEFPTNAFTLATCGLALAATPNPTAILQEMNRVLHPGGWVGITIAHPGGLLVPELPSPGPAPARTPPRSAPALPPPARAADAPTNDRLPAAPPHVPDRARDLPVPALRPGPERWTEEAVAELLLAGGFAAPHVQVVQRAITYVSVDAWWSDGGLTPYGSLGAAPDPDARPALPPELAGMMEERLRGRPLQVPLAVTIGIARKLV